MSSDMALMASEELSLRSETDDGNGDEDDDVCRDFLRNVCRRGNACRFRHPDPSEAEELGKKIEYVFCHDYQNRECRRPNCRFLHCTKQEEEVYRSAGKLPQHVLDRMAQNKASEMMARSTAAAANVPICKDNLKGECRRGPGRCKFRHVSPADYEMEVSSSAAGRGNSGNSQPPGGGGGGGNGSHHSSHAGAAGPHRFDGHSVRNQMHNAFNANAFNDTFAPPEPKRRAYDTGAASAATYGANAFAAAFATDRTGGLSLAALGGGGAGASMADYDAYNNGAMRANPATQGLPPGAIYSSARYLEEENAALRRRIDELKKQVADLMATNEFLLEQNAQLRTLGKHPGAQPPQGPGPQSVAASLAPGPPLPQLSSELRGADIGVGVVVPASLATISTMSGLPVSSIATMSLPTSVSLSNSAPLVSYPIITTQSMRPSIMTHSLGH